MIEQHQLSNQWIQKEISAVIEKDTTIKVEIKQLSTSKCDCENEDTTEWRFPILCALLIPFVIFAAFLMYLSIYLNISGFLIQIIFIIGSLLNCF